MRARQAGTRRDMDRLPPGGRYAAPRLCRGRQVGRGWGGRRRNTIPLCCNSPQTTTAPAIPSSEPWFRIRFVALGGGGRRHPANETKRDESKKRDETNPKLRPWSLVFRRAG